MAESQTYKLFIGGFKCDTTHQEIYQFFNKIGPCKIELKMKRKSKIISLGYCYLTTKDKGMHSKLLNAGKIFFEDRLVEIKPFLRGDELDKFYEEFNARRVQVYDIPKSTTNEELKIYFSEFGPVENAYTIHDFRCSGEKINGFVLFKNSIDAKNVGKIKEFKFNKGYIIKARLFSKETGLDKASMDNSDKNKSRNSDFIEKKEKKKKRKKSLKKREFKQNSPYSKNLLNDDCEFVKKNNLAELKIPSRKISHQASDIRKVSTNLNTPNIFKPGSKNDLNGFNQSFLMSPLLKPKPQNFTFKSEQIKEFMDFNSIKDDNEMENLKVVEEKFIRNRMVTFPNFKPSKTNQIQNYGDHSSRDQCIRLDSFGEKDFEPSLKMERDNNEEKQDINLNLEQVIESEESVKEQKILLPNKLRGVQNHNITPTMNGYYDEGARYEIFKYIHVSFNLKMNVFEKFGF